MSGFAGQRPRPWMGDATPSEPAAGDVSDEAAAVSSMKDLGTSTNASAISFGFTATAILISMFLLMAIFEHLIKPGRASSRGSHDGDDDGHGQSSRSGRHPHDDGSPDKVRHSPKMEPVLTADLTVLMPGQPYPTFLAQPAPLLPCRREGVRWPPHDHRHSFVPP